MNSTWKARQIERRDDVKAIQEVLDVLNRMDTSVTVTDRKYIIMQNGKKRYEITMFDYDATIRAFDGDTLGAVRCVLSEGIVPKAKLWLLKFELESATSSEPLKKLADKVNAFKSDIKLINKVLTVLTNDNTQVHIDHETNVMKRYEILYNMNGQDYRLIVEYNGSLVKFAENGVETTIEGDDYMGWKLSVLRKDLDRKVAPRVPLMTRLTQRLKNRQH